MSCLGGQVMLKVLLLAIVVSTAISAQAKQQEVKAVPGEFVVKLKRALDQTEQVQMLSQLGETGVEQIREDVLLVRKPQGLTNASFLHAFNTSDLVERVEPNYIYTINTVNVEPTNVPNDPKLGELWGLHNTGTADTDGTIGTAGVDIGALAAWDITTGSKDIVVAVIDTGVDYTHPDIAPNAWVNEAEKNGKAGKDDDGNGYVDDVYGYDFANNDADPKDDHGHGTHCSGTIGAKGGDGKGIVGVNWNVSIMGVKFLSASGSGSLEGAIKAIDYATKMKVNVMSNSWGGGGYSETLKESIERAKDAGILFVAAAGNSTNDNDANPEYPAGYEVDNVLSVAALENQGGLAYFSNYGKKTVHVAAPGHNIVSSVLGGKYDSYSGTSMATPHVSGVAALLLSHERNLSYADIKERLIKTSKPLSGTRSRVLSAGIVDAYYALTNKVPPPDANDPSAWANRSNQTVSSTHPYTTNLKESFTVKVPGAKRIAVHFSKFETESGYDKVSLVDGSGKVAGTLSGNLSDSYSAIIQGDTVTLKLEADGTVNGYGFDVDYVSYE
jgi:thermitase